MAAAQACFYLDDDEKEQGPFTHEEMKQWFEDNYFSEDTCIKVSGESFVPIGRHSPRPAFACKNKNLSRRNELMAMSHLSLVQLVEQLEKRQAELASRALPRLYSVTSSPPQCATPPKYHATLVPSDPSMQALFTTSVGPVHGAPTDQKTAKDAHLSELQAAIAAKNPQLKQPVSGVERLRAYLPDGFLTAWSKAGLASPTQNHRYNFFREVIGGGFSQEEYEAAVWATRSGANTSTEGDHVTPPSEPCKHP